MGVMQFDAAKLVHQNSWSEILMLSIFLPAIIVCSMIPRWVSNAMTYERIPKCPPTYRCYVPFIGNLLMMSSDASALMASIATRSRNVPVRLRLLVTDVYVVSGPELIQALWREPSLHTKAYRSLSLINILGIPKHALDWWTQDDSGHHAQPHPESKVPAHLRIDYLHTTLASQFLTGQPLASFSARFIERLRDSLQSHASTEWTEHSDLFAFMQMQLFPSAVEAMCGTKLLSAYPDFVRDYWAYNKKIPLLAKGYPRWLCPAAHKARDKCLEGIKKWHATISSSLKAPVVDTKAWVPEYGAEYIRSRHEIWSKMPFMDADAIAGEDLGMIWAANGNSVPSAFWMVAEVIRDPELLQSIRSTIEQSRVKSEPGTLDFDFAKLCSEPLLQSIYAETLRLHVATFIFRGPDRKDLHLGDWRIPQDSAILVSSHSAQTDPEVWSATSGDSKCPPANTFWPKRFLRQTTDKKAEFSLRGLSAAWIPYGGGQRMCPGRHFAKQEMIVSLAILLTLFDVEMIGASAGIPENDMAGFGFGALWPKSAMPVRMKRRE